MPPSADTLKLNEVVTSRLREGLRTRRNLQDSGRLNVDRPLPYLFIYRRPTDRPDAGTDAFVIGEGSYLIASAAESAQNEAADLASAVTDALSAAFGAVLLVEVWASRKDPDALMGGALVAAPMFVVHMPSKTAGRTVVAALVRALRQVRVLGFRSRVVVRAGRVTPPELPPLITHTAAERGGVLTIGLELPTVFRDPATGSVFPTVHQPLQRGVSKALRRTGFRFAHLQTSHRPEHFHRLGQRTVLRAALQADRELSEIGDCFSLLLAITPVNATEAWEQFRESGYRAEPTLRYRLLHWDPEQLKRRLYGISLERVEDPALTELFRDKREELDRQITLLRDRNTPQFLYESLQLFEGVDPPLLAAAEQIFSRFPRPLEPTGAIDRGCISAEEFAERARREVEAYREQWSGFNAGVELRDDVLGILVSQDRLLIDHRLSVDNVRVEPLLHHEVGTHLLTYCNAAAQPLSLLRTGLPGYEAVQEGTAVLAEYLTGGLTAARLRLLAARVIAVHRRVQGGSLIDLFTELHGRFAFHPQTAFAIALRVIRGGGFTKDAVYLRGLIQVLNYIAQGGEADLLFMGKVSHSAIPILRELRWREVLSPPRVLPRSLNLPGAAERLDRLRRGVDVTTLIAETT